MVWCLGDGQSGAINRTSVCFSRQVGSYKVSSSPMVMEEEDGDEDEDEFRRGIKK